MKYFLLLLAITVSTMASSQSKLSWYKVLSGRIGQSAVTMHLHKAGHNYVGYYYYDAYQQPVFITGEDTTLKGKIRLAAFSDGEDVEYFEFALTANKISGSWKKSDQGRSANFTAQEVKAPIPFAYIFSRGQIKLRPKLKESPVASIDEAAVWPIVRSAIADSVKQLIRRMTYEGNNSNGDIGPIFIKAKKDFFDAYQKDYKDVSDAELLEVNGAYNMDVETRIMVLFQSATLLNLAHFSYTFTGGAHGNYGTSYKVVDLTRNRVLQLSDVLKNGSEKAVLLLLEKQFRLQYGVADTDSLQDAGLFENSMKLTDNFFITGKGIGFTYQPYEIGPYAMGEISLFIPLSQISLYLQPEITQLMK